MLALDLSFGAATVTPAWCAARAAEGCGLLIAGAWTGNRSPAGVEAALRYAREAGMLIAAYYVPHAFRTPDRHLASARGAIGGEWPNLQFVALDVEDIGSGDPMPAQWTGEQLRVSAKLVTAARQLPIIYTNNGAWAPAGLGTAFAHLPLWKANYPSDPASAYPPDLTADFGGWTACVGHQRQRTHDVDGVACDLSEFDDTWLPGAQHSDEPPPAGDAARANAANVAWGVGAALLGPARLTRQNRNSWGAQLQDVARYINGAAG